MPRSLSLADLYGFGPVSTFNGEALYRCPLPECGEHSDASLKVNEEMGLWICFRCEARGLLREYATKDRAAIRASRLERAFALRSAPKPKADAFDGWRRLFGGSCGISKTPGEKYLWDRGIDPQDVIAAGCRFSPSWFGGFKASYASDELSIRTSEPRRRGAVLFPVLNESGRLIAVNSRYLDDSEPKSKSHGRRSLGVFATAGAFGAEILVVSEAPIDALSLTRLGLPALGLCGTGWPDWLPRFAAFRDVLIATDADQPGERCATKLARECTSLGAKCWRLPPPAKDWNDALGAYGYFETVEILAWLLEPHHPDLHERVLRKRDSFDIAMSIQREVRS